MAWLKRINAPNWWPISRKEVKYVVVPRGSHKKKLPLLVVVRDVLKLADNAREAKTLIKLGKIFVDGRRMKDIKYGVGPMDIVQIPEINKAWRAVPRNGLTFVETDGEDAKMKICKIADKKILKKNKVQLNLSEGRNILTADNYSTKDSILVEVPSQKILDSYAMKKGNLAIITGGKYEGIVSEIGDIDSKNRRIWMNINEKITEIPIKFVTVVGKEKPAVKIE